MPDVPTPPVLALVRDLIFASRITATARLVQVDVNLISDPARLADQPGSLLIVDLNLPGAVDAAANWKRTHNREVVGFVSHVDTETITRAQQAGLDRAMARSGFVAALATILKAAPQS